MSPHSSKRFRRLIIYLMATCFLLGGFILRLWYGFDRADETSGVGDRIVTITQFAYRYGPDIWSVGEFSIYVFRASDQSSIVVPLDADMVLLLKGEVAKIPDGIRGTYTSNCSCDGLNVEVEFTPDGKYRHDQISANDFYMKELDPLFTLINSVLPREHWIKYNLEMRRMHQRGEYPYSYVYRMTQSERNRQNSTPFSRSGNSVTVPLDEIFPEADAGK